ncbi:MAG: hypothetical protein HZC29_05770 [Thaumarchaeota archaeon]|nr:hypothetical protein [Nitrososphaerota archaeon]
MSRGLSEQEARMKIVQGYFTQLTKCVHSPAIMTEIQRLIHQKLKLPDTADDMDEFTEHIHGEDKTTGDAHA